MSRSRTWSPRLAAVLASVAIVVAACGGAAPSAAPSSSTGQASAAPSAAESSAPFEALAYPETGEAPCAQAEAPDAEHSAYTGNFKKISATDDKTVVFELCSPDVAFLSKIAFTSFAINDTAWLESKIDPAKADNQAICLLYTSPSPRD